MRHEWHKSGSALLDEIRHADNAPGLVSVWALGQCGFLFSHEGKRVLIDPMLNDLRDAAGQSLRLYDPPFQPDQLSVDLVICTHGHCDHMAVETLTELFRANSQMKLMLPAGCLPLARQAGFPEGSLLPMKDGSVHACGSLSVRAFSAAHPVHIDDEHNPDMALGCFMSFGQMNVVHLGDTYLTPRLLGSLRSLGRIRLLMLPVNGRDLFREANDIVGNLSCEEAACLAAQLKAEVSIPMHYDMISGNTADPLIFVRTLLELDPSACFRLPALGEQMLFRC